MERIYNDDSHIYYVNSWLHNRTYTKFCSKLRALLHINVYDNVCEDVLDGNEPVETSIKKYCSALVYDEEFRVYLNNLDCSVVVEEEEASESTIEEDYYSDTTTDTVEDTELEEENTINELGSDDINTELGIDADKDEQEATNRTTQSKHSNTSKTRIQLDGINETSKESVTAHAESHTRPETDSRNASCSTTAKQTLRLSSRTTSKPRQPRVPQGHYGSHGNNYEPREWTKDDIERIKAKGVSRCLSEGDAEPIEIEQLNTLLGSNMSAEEIADTNYLAQMRLYQNLVDYGDEPQESIEAFVKSKKIEHNLSSGKYIHKCSAKYGIVYISPSIWNKVASGRCVLCVYLGKRAKDFMYLRSIEDILNWVHEDDILIKLTGEEKEDVVKTLYSGVLDGVTGTAYTMIRVASNAIYNTVFAPLMDDPDQEDSVDDV